MDGYEAVAAMRKQGVKLPVIALTANAMKGYEQRVLKAGFSHYMTKPINLDELTALLAELLGGSYTVVDSGPAPVAVRVEPSSAVDAGPVYSTMAQQNPKFEAIAKQFVVRLETQMQEMQACRDRGDFAELANHAHWLKGSGGTVGFAEFAEPAKALEVAAKQHEAGNAQNMLDAIKDIQSRISFDNVGSDVNGAVSGKVTGPETVHQLPEQTPVTAKSASTVVSTPTEADKTKEAEVESVYSTLPMDNPRFRGIVEKFIPRLEEQLIELRSALSEEDFDAMAKLAHWLKGSSGNVGFEGFTPLASALEASAEAQDTDQLKQDFRAVALYAGRVKQGWDTLEPLEKSA